MKFTLVAATQATDPIWSLIQRGANQAAKDMGVSLTYDAPSSTGAGAIAQLVNSAVSAQPDGLVVALTDCAGMTPGLQQAQLVGIPIIAINFGSTCAAKLGVLSYIGQIDYQAGLAGGQKLAAAGARHVICVTPDTSNPAYNDRCRGVGDALKKAGGQLDVVAVALGNASAAQQKLAALYAQDPTIDGAIAVDAGSAAVTIPPSQHLVRTSTFFLASFDLSPAVLQAIQQGAMQFAIDQQPYLQGYLAVVWLSLYKRNLDTVVTPVIPTGPTFVTSANVAQVEQLVAAGTR